MKFRCWDPEMHDEDDALEIEAPTAREAAGQFAEKRFRDDSYPQRRTVNVLALDVRTFDVATEMDPSFVANERVAKS